MTLNESESSENQAETAKLFNKTEYDNKNIRKTKRLEIIKFALWWCFGIFCGSIILMILDMKYFKLNSHAIVVLVATISAILSALIAAVIGSSID